jgi:hypothetical protein
MSNSQRAMAARRERPQPKYIARAKVQNGWVSIGAAWPLRSGEEGFSLKLTTIPLNWDGRFVLLPPLENEDVGDTGEGAADIGDAQPAPRARRRRTDEEIPV